MASLDSSNKALIITALLSALVVLLTFNLHLKKKNKLVAETFFQIIPEDEIEQEKEELAEILKSLDDVIKTNKAFNETREFEDFEDEEFKNTMEKIRNREARNDNIQDEVNKVSGANEYEAKTLASYENVNDVINNRSDKKRASVASNQDDRIKNSSVSYSLVNRSDVHLPPPIYLCERGGKIVVSIEVDGEGNVTKASYNSASNSENGCLIDHALEYAKASKFNSDPQKAMQLGTITFYFKGKY